METPGMTKFFSFFSLIAYSLQPAGQNAELRRGLFLLAACFCDDCLDQSWLVDNCADAAASLNSVCVMDVQEQSKGRQNAVTIPVIAHLPKLTPLLS